MRSYNVAHPARGKENKMEVDLVYQQNATDIHSQSSYALDLSRKQEGTTKRDAEKIRGARNEGSRVELGPDRKSGSRQTTMAFICVGIMCEHAQRGLSGKNAVMICS